MTQQQQQAVAGEAVAMEADGSQGDMEAGVDDRQQGFIEAAVAAMDLG